MLFKASAPGSLMLLGEYAVLYNQQAVVCAVNKRITVTLRARADEQVALVSDRYGQVTTRLSELAVPPPFQFVSACLAHYRHKLMSGCDIHITSEFSDQIGLGSSAAVTVATLAVLEAWLNIPFDHARLIRQARRIVRQVQTVGSGADVAASVMGGMVAYRAKPLQVEKFPLAPFLTVIYSGSKTGTVAAIHRVQDKFAACQGLLHALCRAIDQCAREGVQALRQGQWPQLGAVMTIQQGLMQALGVSTPLLDDLIERLRTDPAIHGAKISGAGWGDCVLGLGQAAHLGVEERYQGVQQIGVQVTQQGVLLA